MDAIKMMQSVDFNWTRQLEGVWDDPWFDVPELHNNVRDEIMRAFGRMIGEQKQSNLLGKVIAGVPGVGKTHLLGTIRQAVQENGHWFVLIDMTDVRNFYETTLLGFLDSLQRPYPDGRL